MSYTSSSTVNQEIYWYSSTSIHKWSNDREYATIIYLSKNSLDRYLFPPVCVIWSAKVMKFIPQEKFILLDRFQWLFKICLLSINLWIKKHAYAQELGFEKKKIKLVETYRTLIIQRTHYTQILHLQIAASQFSFFSERRTITGLNLLPLSNCKEGCHQLSLCTK